jgi:hypothetical protein
LEGPAFLARSSSSGLIGTNRGFLYSGRVSFVYGRFPASSELDPSPPNLTILPPRRTPSVIAFSLLRVGAAHLASFRDFFVFFTKGFWPRIKHE